MRQIQVISQNTAGLRHLNRCRRAGFMYIVVLGLTVLVSVMALSAMTVARTEITVVGGVSDWHEARQLALTAIENGIASINSDPDWRTGYVNDTACPGPSGTAMGNGYFVWKLVDSDGSLDDSNSDSVRLHGIGYVRDTVYAASVLLQPTGAPLSCLQTSLHADRDLDLDFGTITSGQIISTNRDAGAANGVTVNADVQASGSISGATYNGVNTAGYPSRGMPDPATLFDYYASNGTEIPITSLPQLAGVRFLEEVVLSPATSSWGPTDADGVYVIDCRKATLVIRNCRIVGTLVILNPGSDSRIEQSVSMEAAIDYFPTLLVDDDFELSFSQTELTESSFAVSFNPPSTPFPYLQGSGSNQDIDYSDSYPSRITGLVYIAGRLHVPGNAPTVHGCVVVGSRFELGAADLRLKYRRTWFNFPPPGFTVGDVMDIAPGTWRRETP
ncbi:MAG: hypothetical protein RIK87_00210 [Fuerstiella sp.]